MIWLAPLQNDNSSNSSDSRGAMDPRLRNFLRQAVALIASEKGLNARSRYKLQSLADHLKLPPELFQQALVQLQQSDDASIQLNHWEKDFVAQLRRSFTNLEKKILTVSAEARIVSRASERFQISKIRAKQLIDHCAEQHGIARVSEADAQDYVKLLILEKIGTSIEIAKEAQTQLHRVGTEWGVPFEDVDRVILETLAKNRSAQKNRKTRWPIAIAVTGLMVIVLAVFAYQINWRQFVELDSGGGTELGADENLKHESISPFAPLFGDNELHARVQALVVKHPKLGQVFEELNSNDVQVRGPALVKMAVEAFEVEQPLIPSDVTLDILVNEGAFSVQQQVVTALAEPLILVERKQPVASNEFAKALRAIGLLTAIRYSDSVGSSTDIGPFCKLIDQELKISVRPSPEEYRLDLSRDTALRYWDHAIGTCWVSPGRAAVLLEPLTKATREFLTPEQLSLNRDRLLEGVIASDFSRWREVKPTIAESVAEANEIRLTRWIGVFENNNELAFRDFLGPLISRKIAPNAIPNDRSAIVALLTSKRDEIRYRQFQGLIQRHETLSEASTDLLNETRMIEQKSQPELVANLARQSNLSLALTIATKVSRSDFAWYDQKVSRPFALRSYGDVAKSGLAVRERGVTRASLSDRREFEKSIGRLGEPGISAVAKRSALDSLGSVADRFDDVSYQDAAILASYLLSEMELAEWLNCEKNIPSFRRWPTLGIAVSDQFPQAQLSLDRGLTLATLLIGRPVSVADANQWRQKLQNDLFMAIRANVDRRLAVEPSKESLDWRRLEDALLDLYRARFELVQMYDGLSAAEDVSVATGHEQWLESVAVTLARRTEGGVDLSRKLDFSRREPAHKLERIVALNQLSIEVFVARLKDDFPESGPDCDRLFQEFSERASAQSDVGRRLLVAERAWLELCDLLRRLALERKLRQS